MARSNVIDFELQHSIRNMTVRSISNFLWFYRFEMSMLSPDDPKVKEIENDPHHIALHKEVQRRMRLGDREIQELYG